MTLNSESSDIMGVWVIQKNSGLPVLSLELGDSRIDSTLFSGFLVAIRSMMQDFEIGELSSFQTDVSNLVLTSSEKLISVIGLEKTADSDCWYPILVKIHQRVQEEYDLHQGERIVVETKTFEPLKSELTTMILDHIETLKKQKESCVTPKEEKAKKKAKAENKLEESGLW